MKWSWPRICIALTAVCIVLTVVVSTAGARPSRLGLATVALGKGEESGFRWGVYAHRDKGQGGGKRPCITVRLLHREGQFVGESDSVICKALPPTGPFIILSESVGEGNSEFTVYGLAYALRVSKVALEFSSTGARTVQLHTLSQRQRRRAGLRRFRYGAFALRGDNCLEEVTGFDSSGQIVYHHFLQQCASTEG